MDQRKKTGNQRAGNQKLRNQKSILTVGVITLAAVIALAGLSFRRSADNEGDEQEAVIMAEAEWSEETDDSEDELTNGDDGISIDREDTDESSETDTDESSETEAVSGTDAGEQDDSAALDTIEGAVETAGEATAATSTLTFSESDTLSWPLDGDVILNYSMDHSVYFATLDQYKYNPALIIQGEVNDQVIAAAAGQVVSIETSEETGETVTMDIGNGYQLVYGQLKEIQVDEGSFVAEGDLIGFISEPTKYYSVEGCNLYFQMQKDGEPVNPLNYLE